MNFKKYTLIFLYLICMTITLSSVFAENSSSVKIHITIRESYNPEAELVLLKNDAPIKIEAEIIAPKNTEYTLKDGYKVEWKTTFGKIQQLNNPLTAILTPEQMGMTSQISVSLVGKVKIFNQTQNINILDKKTVISPVSYKKYFKNGEVAGYKVGEYLDPKNEKELKKYNVTTNWHRIYPEKFAPPEFFYIVNNENKSLKITPHYKLGDYALDFPWFSQGMPQAIALDYGLFTKLEDIQSLMNNDGYKFEKFSILYGFRPPSFNLGTILSDGENSLKAPFSQHQFGKAIDILIDTDGDLVIDDLNKDGKINMKDAAVILHYVNILDRQYREAKDPRMGGAGIYKSHDFTGRIQSPYIHIDTRNFTTSNGYLLRWPNDWEDGSPIDHGKI